MTNGTVPIALQINMEDAGRQNSDINFQLGYEYLTPLASHTITAGWNVGVGNGTSSVDYYAFEERAEELSKANEELQKYRVHLEKMIQERTTELQKTVNLLAGRELRMAELKKVIKKLSAQLEEAGLTPVADDPLKEMRKMESGE